MQRENRFVWLGLFVLLSVALVATWWSRPLGGLERLEHNPMASLIYPGSVLIRQGGDNGGPGMDGPVSASTTKQLGSSDSLEAILAFYRQKMTSAGWATGGGSSVVGSGIERQICVWHKEGIVARLSFWKPDQWAKMHPKDVAYATVYEIALIEKSPTRTDLACASPDF